MSRKISARNMAVGSMGGATLARRSSETAAPMASAIALPGYINPKTKFLSRSRIVNARTTLVRKPVLSHTSREASIGERVDMLLSTSFSARKSVLEASSA